MADYTLIIEHKVSNSVSFWNFFYSNWNNEMYNIFEVIVDVFGKDNADYFVWNTEFTKQFTKKKPDKNRHNWGYGIKLNNSYASVKLFCPASGEMKIRLTDVKKEDIDSLESILIK